jgi:FdrA protein
MSDVVINQIRRAFYLDSVALMRLSREIARLEGVEEAGLMMGTPANKQILAAASILAPNGEAAQANDLILAVRAESRTAADAALATANAALEARQTRFGGAAIFQPRTIRSALKLAPEANLALISVPGDFAAPEARKALRRGLNVLIFSNNVAVADEVALKQEARRLGLLVMGPDCGTAIINGVPLAFANKVPRGQIGIIGASGTGIQEISCLIARLGQGISQAIGTGGRDLQTEVGGISTLMSIDLLDADPATEHIVLISKPPDSEIAARIVERIKKSAKLFTVCFLGMNHLTLPSNAKRAPTLKAAAELATARTLPSINAPAARGVAKDKLVRGLFSGGTLCAEAQIEFLAAGVPPASNIPVPGAEMVHRIKASHQLIDFGDDKYTRGRPHPMIEPAVRDEPLTAALEDPAVGVILLDVVLGFGGHRDPAGHLVAAVAKAGARRAHITASVTGVNGDPQGYADQIAKLEAAGVSIAGSNADAARLALWLIGKP